MKSIMSILVSLLSAVNLYSQASDDDVYFSPKDEAQVIAENARTQPQHAEEYNYDDDNGYYDDEYYSDTETQSDGSGNTYITNNYYGDYYDYDNDDYNYTSHLQRYYSPYMGFSYYSSCYTGFYYDPWSWNVSIGFGWGYPNYGYPYYNYGYHPYYDPWYGYGCSSSYYGHGYGGWGYPYNNWYCGGYGHGYNHGYWDGYYHGYYDGSYGYSNGGYYGGGYYYGPRREAQGISSYRNEKRAEEIQKVAGQNVNQFPVGENRDMLQPVRTGNEVKQGQDVIKKNETESLRNDVKTQNQYNTFDKGAMQPVKQPSRNDVKPQNQYNTFDKGNVQPNYQPSRGNEAQQAPIDKNQIQQKPGVENNPNIERQTNPGKEGHYNMPSRGNMHDRNAPQTAPRGNENRDMTPQNAPKYQNQKPERSGYIEKEQISPKHQPKTYDRGNQTPLGNYEKQAPQRQQQPANTGKQFGGSNQQIPRSGMQPR